MAMSAAPAMLGTKPVDEYGIEVMASRARPAATLQHETVVTYPAEWHDGKHDGRLCWSVIERRLGPWQPAPEPDRVEIVRGVALCVPSRWTEAIVAAWLAEAVRTQAILAGPWPGPSRLEAAHLAFVRDANEAYGYTRSSAPERPTPDQLTRHDYAMPDWLLVLDGTTDRKIVCGVAAGLSLRVVGRLVGLSHEAVRERWHNAIRKICATLNFAVDKTA